VTEHGSLSANDIAAFVDGRLTGDDLTRVESLLADDPAARMEVAEASRLIATAPRRTIAPSRWLAIGGIAAVAAAALIILRPGSQQEHAPAVSERRARIDASERVELVSPVDGQTVRKSDLALTWRGVQDAVYRVVVSDPVGKIVFEVSTNDTSVVAPLMDLNLPNGIVYWSVDALAPDGSSLTSGVRELTVAPN
jgi:anti-sigma factor RsiW